MEEAWHAARLIPTSGINGAEEQERRATSALLAVLASVKEFGRSIVGPLGAPAGTLETYIEVPFDLDGHRLYPDGLIRARRGQRTWTALVEVKTQTNALLAPQIENYLDVARNEGFDAVLTISNQIATLPGVHPTAVDKRKLRKVALHHLSWTQVLTEAVMQKVHRGVSDPEQAWILGELIRYLEHPRSGAMEFEDMGASWVTVRDSVTSGTLRATDKPAAEVSATWDQLIRYAGLRLGRQLGSEVQPVLSRRELAEPMVRAQSLVSSLAKDGRLEGSLRVPNAAGDVVISADLRGQRVSCSITVDAPRDGRALTRVRWLVRQLTDASDDLRIDAFAAHARGASSSELLKNVRADQAALIDDPKRDLRSFRVTASAPMGVKRGQGRGSFVGNLLALLDSFYEDVVHRIRPWTGAPPAIRRPTEDDINEPDVPQSLVSTAISSQDASLEDSGDAEHSAAESAEPTLPSS